jgi:hypothetical protein
VPKKVPNLKPICFKTIPSIGQYAYAKLVFVWTHGTNIIKSLLVARELYHQKLANHEGH